MKRSSHLFAAALVFVFAALLMAAGASAATARISITGSVITGPADPATIDLAAASDLGGANANGTITLTSPTMFAGATTNVFHGDIVAGGCVRVQGSRAIIVGKLPPGEVFTFTGPPPFGPITHVAALIEDNGDPSGTPVDRAAAIWLKSTSATAFCTTKPFSDVASTVIALDAGDASFGYTDFLDGFPSNPDTTVSVVNPNGLSVAITDEPDGATGEGLNVAVGAGSGSAQLMACGLPTYPVAGSTVVITCASLILRVVVGSAEVVLGAGLTVSVPQGGKAEIAERPDGNFTVENQGSQPIGVTIDGVTQSIAPGGTATVGLPGEMIADLVDKTLLYLDKPALAPALKAQLQAAAAALVAKKPKVACLTMSVYIAAVKVAPSSAFTSAEKAELTADAKAIRDAIGC